MIKGKVAVLTVYGAGFSFIGNVFAIAPKYHRTVTLKAIEEYSACIQELGAEDTLSEGADTIADFAKIEDESPLITRVFNWHFYDAYRGTEHEMGLAITGAKKSMHDIFAEHQASLARALKKNDKEGVFEFTGRLLHFIQDVTVPAHVAPIYHYKFLWFDDSDNFDEMPEWGTSTFTKPQDLCLVDEVDLGNLNARLDSILDKTALETRARIREEIPVDEGHRLAGKTWQEFWVVRDPADDSNYSGVYYGFAPYGKEGRDGFRNLCESADSGRRACQHLLQKSFDSAVTSTVRTLLLVNTVNSGSRKANDGDKASGLL